MVDDGSTDNTADVVSHFGNSVRYVYQNNTGVSSARNLGAQVARYEWLTFLDADDWYYPNRLKLHAELIRKYPDIDFLTGNFDYVGTDRKPIRHSMQSSSIGLYLIRKSGGGSEVLMEDDELGGFVEQQFGDTRTLSVPRRTFFEIGGFPVDFQICEDVHLLIRLCAVSRRVGVICEPIAAYLIHDRGLIRSDKLRAQNQTVEALLSLRRDISNARPCIVAGLENTIRSARLDLATVLLRQGRRTAAICAVLPTLLAKPGWCGFRDLISMIRGLRKVKNYG